MSEDKLKAYLEDEGYTVKVEIVKEKRYYRFSSRWFSTTFLKEMNKIIPVYLFTVSPHGEELDVCIIINS